MATLLMIAVIWFLQIVHYPLFEKVGADRFALYSEAHSRLTGYVVGQTMLAEAGIALLVVSRRPEGVPLAAALLGLALVVLFRLSTVLLQVLRHTILGSGFDRGAHSGLVLTNRTRTVAPARGVLVLWRTARAIG